MHSITATTGATIQGQLLARNGAVTNGYCATTSGGTTDTAVRPTAKAVTQTVTGGELPKTSTPLYGLLLTGTILTIVGALGWRKRKSYE